MEIELERATTTDVEYQQQTEAMEAPPVPSSDGTGTMEAEAIANDKDTENMHQDETTVVKTSSSTKRRDDKVLLPGGVTGLEKPETAPSGHPPKLLLGLDHVRGNFRSFDQHMVGFLGLVILAFTLVGNIKRNMETSLFDSDWNSTYTFLLYVIACVPFAILYQFANAGNQPKSHWTWCVLGASACALCGTYQLWRLANEHGGSGVFTLGASRGLQFASVACWWLCGLAQLLYAAHELFGLPLPSRLRHNEILRNARHVIVHGLLKGKAAAKDRTTTPQGVTTKATTAIAGSSTSAGKAEKNHVPLAAAGRDDDDDEKTDDDDDAARRRQASSYPRDGEPVRVGRHAADLKKETVVAAKDAADAPLMSVVVVANPAYDVRDLGDGLYEIVSKTADGVDLDAVFFVCPRGEEEAAPGARAEALALKNRDASRPTERPFIVRGAGDEKAADEGDETSGGRDNNQQEVEIFKTLCPPIPGAKQVSSCLRGLDGNHHADGTPLAPVEKELKEATRTVKRARPPIVFASALGSLLIIAALASSFLSVKLRRFGRIAAEMRDTADVLDDADIDETGDSLRNYANSMEQTEEDINAAWQVGCWSALVFMLCVVATYVPKFDQALDKAKRGGFRKEGPLRPQETVGHGAAILGAYLSIALIGYLLFAFVLTVAAFLLINQAFREFIWGFRVLAVSYACAYFLNFVILQPYVFHSLASDGYIIRRDVFFYCCNIAWTAYGVFVGATIALVRIGLYVAWCIAATGDLSTSILPPALRGADFAHMAFTAEVHLHNHHHNTVMHVFADMLLRHAEDNRRQRQKGGDDDNEASPSAHGPRPGSHDDSAEAQTNALRVAAHRRARNKWQLAYTLLHNPALRLEHRSGGKGGLDDDDDDDNDDVGGGGETTTTTTTTQKTTGAVDEV